MLSEIPTQFATKVVARHIAVALDLTNILNLCLGPNSLDSGNVVSTGCDEACSGGSCYFSASIKSRSTSVSSSGQDRSRSTPYLEKLTNVSEKTSELCGSVYDVVADAHVFAASRWTACFRLHLQFFNPVFGRINLMPFQLIPLLSILIRFKTSS